MQMVDKETIEKAADYLFSLREHLENLVKDLEAQKESMSKIEERLKQQERFVLRCKSIEDLKFSSRCGSNEDQLELAYRYWTTNQERLCREVLTKFGLYNDYHQSNDSHGFYSLGIMFREGWGLEQKDLKRSKLNFLKSAILGCSEATTALWTSLDEVHENLRRKIQDLRKQLLSSWARVVKILQNETVEFNLKKYLVTIKSKKYDLEKNNEYLLYFPGKLVDIGIESCYKINQTPDILDKWAEYLYSLLIDNKKVGDSEISAWADDLVKNMTEFLSSRAEVSTSAQHPDGDKENILISHLKSQISESLKDFAVACVELFLFIRAVQVDMIYSEFQDPVDHEIHEIDLEKAASGVVLFCKFPGFFGPGFKFKEAIRY